MNNMNEIKTPRDFRAAVLLTLDENAKSYKGSLEEYLCSLWALIKQNSSATPSLALFAKLIQQAFSEKPHPFDDSWLQYDQQLSWNKVNGEYVIEGLDGMKLVYLERQVNDFRILEHTILFQIADLHHMSDQQLNNPFRYFGTTSPKGHVWNNLDIYSYIKIGTGGSGAHAGWLDEEILVDWGDLAGILTAGQEYE
jgi:hypothetical protein